MANMMDYLLWRGDLTIDRAPWCVIDTLLLANLSYNDMETFVSDEQGMELEALAPLLSLPQKTGNIYFEQWRTLFYAMAESERFRHMRVCRYINDIDPSRLIQFCAMTFAFEGGPTVVAYRGTDASLVGWREDCALAYETVPAQLAALRYLEETARLFDGPIITTGHSKGGNLSAYAGSHASPEVQDRLVSVCSFDGPGLDNDTLSSDGYARIEPRLCSVIPQSSVVGLLLGYIPRFTIVRSVKSGILQHDSFSWQLKGPAFDTLSEMDDGSRLMDRTLHDWLSGCTSEERRIFADALFGILGAGNAETTYDLLADKRATLAAMIQASTGMDPETKRVFFGMLGRLFTTGTGDLFAMLGERFGSLPPIAQLADRMDDTRDFLEQLGKRIRSTPAVTQLAEKVEDLTGHREDAPSTEERS